jgi:hypothetical protein
MHQDRNNLWDDCKSSCGRYTRPDHNRRTWDSDIVWDACKHRGHSATNCDMLTMALFLAMYVKMSMTPTTCNRIEAAWLERWKETLGNPHRLPRKVLKAYLDSLGIYADMLDDQMDWECWLENDMVEDFG